MVSPNFTSEIRAFLSHWNDLPFKRWPNPLSILKAPFKTHLYSLAFPSAWDSALFECFILYIVFWVFICFKCICFYVLLSTLNAAAVVCKVLYKSN